MKIVLLIAAERGIRCLQRIIELKKNEELIVFTFKESPWEPPFSERINEICMREKIDFYCTNKIHDKEYNHVWAILPDLMFSIGWRYLIPKERFSASRIGSFVFHDSLLPNYRGFSPTVWAMRNGEAATGASLFEMTENMDEGDIVDQRKVAIGPNDYIDKVVDDVTETYLRIIEDNYENLKNGEFTRTKQNHNDATYTSKLLPEDFHINWYDTTNNIFNLIRSYVYPYPYSFFYLNGQKIRVKSAIRITDRNYVGAIPGRVIGILKDKGVDVITGNGIIRLVELIHENDNVHNAEKIINKLSYTLK